MDAMIDTETAATTPDALILTIAVQQFDPHGSGHNGQSFYARVDIESQPNRTIDEGTIEWWAKQAPAIKDEAFAEDGRISLREALDGVHKIAWQSNRIWMQGPHFDATILEHAYREINKAVPWAFWKLRDSRTLFSLVPELTKPPVSHHALDDCRRQILMVQDALDYLKVRKLS